MKDRNHEKLCQAYWDLMQRVRSDPEYRCLRERLGEMEPQYEAILASLPESDRITIEFYVTLRESMNCRMLEYVCEEIVTE